MINTIFHFIDDPTFDYAAAIANGDISEYTIVLNSADRSIYCKGTEFGRMTRTDLADVLGDMSGILPAATENKLGGIKIGYTSSTDSNSRRYAVKLDQNDRAYVDVPWSDTITPAFDDSQIRQTVNTERERIDALIHNIGDIVDQKNRQLYADSQWVNDVFGNGEEPGTIAWAYRNQIDGYLNSYNVWEYVDPNHPELGKKARISEIQQDINGITTRVGSAESNINGLTTTTSTLTQRANAIETRVGAVETKADGIDTALSSFEQSVNTEIGGIKTAHTNLSSNVASYETTNDGNIGNLIKMAAAVLDLKASSDAQGNLSTTTDLANVITNGSFTGYSGLSQRVSQTESGVSANASLIADVQGTVNGLDVDGKVTRATAGLASETWVGQNYDTKGSASTAESNAKGYADSVVAGAKASLLASVDKVCAGIGVTVTKDANGNYSSVTQIDADDIYLNGKTWAQYIGVGQIVADTLTAGTATIQAKLKVGGSSTPGTIEMYNSSDTKVGIWDASKFAVGTTSSPSSSNSAMLINADGSGSAAKGNISWNANGDVTVKGTLDGCDGTFSGSLSAVSLSGMTISGNQIEGGSIVVGGSGNATNGSIVVKDVNNTELGRLDKTGISASQGTIGGFTIGTDKLSNTNYNASISIKNANSTQISNIGKDAVDAMTNQSCSLEAQSKGTGTYNTALYLNADGATYNYAFHGNGNGVLNGLIFGFKTKVYTVSGSSDSTTDMSITDGATFVFKGSKTNGWANFKVPTLNNVKQALGLSTSSTTPFAIEVNFINHSSYDHVKLFFYNSSRTTLPKWYSYNFDETTDEMQLAKGDFAKFLLTYDGSEYRANRICHFDDGWG